VADEQLAAESLVKLCQMDYGQLASNSTAPILSAISTINENTTTNNHPTKTVHFQDEELENNTTSTLIVEQPVKKARGRKRKNESAAVPKILADIKNKKPQMVTISVGNENEPEQVEAQLKALGHGSGETVRQFYAQTM
jgi:sugar diacid utilization regulator